PRAVFDVARQVLAQPHPRDGSAQTDRRPEGDGSGVPLERDLDLFSVLHGENATLSLMATKTDDEWKKSLTPEQFHVLREHGTERAGTSVLNQEKRAGTFRCAGCGQPLFSSD